MNPLPSTQMTTVPSFNHVSSPSLTHPNPLNPADHSQFHTPSPQPTHPSTIHTQQHSSFPSYSSLAPLDSHKRSLVSPNRFPSSETSRKKIQAVCLSVLDTLIQLASEGSSGEDARWRSRRLFAGLCWVRRGSCVGWCDAVWIWGAIAGILMPNGVEVWEEGWIAGGCGRWRRAAPCWSNQEFACVKILIGEGIDGW